MVDVIVDVPKTITWWYSVHEKSCSTNQVRHGSQDELTLNQIRKWYQGGVKMVELKILIT